MGFFPFLTSKALLSATHKGGQFSSAFHHKKSVIIYSRLSWIILPKCVFFYPCRTVERHDLFTCPSLWIQRSPVLHSLTWVYQNRLYFFLFTSYLMHYLIPGLPVHNSLWTGSQVEDRAKTKRKERGATEFSSWLFQPRPDHSTRSLFTG